MQFIPNPGSPEAVAQGCTCPIEDNRHGKGSLWSTDDELIFWRTSGCPLHGFVPTEAESKIPEKAEEK